MKKYKVMESEMTHTEREGHVERVDVMLCSQGAKASSRTLPPPPPPPGCRALLWQRCFWIQSSGVQDCRPVSSALLSPPLMTGGSQSPLPHPSPSIHIPMKDARMHTYINAYVKTFYKSEVTLKPTTILTRCSRYILNFCDIVVD